MFRPTVQAGLAVYAAYTMLLRHLVLGHGASLAGDAPSLLYLVYRVVWGTKLPFAWRYAAQWLALPIGYFVYLLVRGQIAFSTALLLTLGAYLTGLAVIRLSRMLTPAGTPDSACCH